ncbi:MAG: spore germination protein [Clostridia bacterium]|nr:spore germination protein [Clostridia bacterium]
MQENERLSGNFEKDADYHEKNLSLSESFDLSKRYLRAKNGQRCALFYITGFADTQTAQDFMRYCLEAEELKLSDETIPYVEASRSAEVETVIKKIMSGMTCFMIEGEREVYLMDMRRIPARSVSEPENDKVLRGARDGFGETLQPNAAMIRRRIRDTRLTFSVLNVGSETKSDVCICYMEGVADGKYVESLKKQISSLKLKSLNFQCETLCEALIKKRWYNPFPKVRYTERPDAAAAAILEGSVIVLCDNSPSAIILPTSIFDFFQETDDFCFQPLTGSYLRIIRFLVYVCSIYLTPVWYYLLMRQELLPPALDFIKLSAEAGIPVFWQLIIVEIAIDGLRLASLNTPDALGSSLSVVGGLILGDFAVNSGWFSPDVILYTAFVTIANFTQTSYELGYAVKFVRLLMLALVHILGGYGILLGTLIMLTLIATNKSIDGSRSYLYPLIPFDKKALKRLMVRSKFKE